MKSSILKTARMAAMLFLAIPLILGLADTATAQGFQGGVPWQVGDVIICGQYYGRVRALINEEAKRLKEAGPSVAVKVLGLNGVPEAGLEFSVVEDEKAARGS